MKLLINGLVKFTCGLLLVGLLLFLPAGTVAYARGWLLTGLLFVPMLAVGFVMFFRDPEFLARRGWMPKRSRKPRRESWAFPD